MATGYYRALTKLHHLLPCHKLQVVLIIVLRILIYYGLATKQMYYWVIYM